MLSDIGCSPEQFVKCAEIGLKIPEDKDYFEKIILNSTEENATNANNHHHPFPSPPLDVPPFPFLPIPSHSFPLFPWLPFCL